MAEVAATFRLLVVDLGLLAIGLAAYGALFALVGTVLKRPLVVGLVFAFGWEQVALVMPGYLKRFTLVPAESAGVLRVSRAPGARQFKEGKGITMRFSDPSDP